MKEVYPPESAWGGGCECGLAKLEQGNSPWSRRQANYEDKQQLCCPGSFASGDRLLTSQLFAVLWAERLLLILTPSLKYLPLSEFYLHAALQVNSSLTHAAVTQFLG